MFDSSDGWTLRGGDVILVVSIIFLKESFKKSSLERGPSPREDWSLFATNGFTIVGATAVLLTTVGCNCGVLEIKGGVTEEFSTEEYEKPGCGVLSITIFRAS
ncbi:hypothetical protein AVEN_21887-1 [Araneus ventricosus]|uniref:Uncharacterized protein n=1 Tax=Araneus ventricosus TaxID=182803 RepID=A0A4Y2VF24_ARAVE|nr:hypothetical protein AVEN_21887-1 [Araneus ventricosus]